MQPVIAIHGGAGNPSPERVGDEAPYHRALHAAITAAIDRAGDGALAAAVAAVELLEDAPQFNAGRGSVLTSAGNVQMDAAVMDGHSGRAGAVAAVHTARHPVALARSVMEHTPHVLLVAEGADRFAAEQGLELMDPAWFIVERRIEDAPGTVGAVVVDADGRLAAATSTGGRRGQLPGRVGDTPVIGAGTFADGRRAISMTGHGEQVLHQLSAASIARSPAPLGQAADDAIAALGDSEAGAICVDSDGNVALPFNTRIMHRGWWTGGDVHTRVGRAAS